MLSARCRGDRPGTTHPRGVVAGFFRERAALIRRARRGGSGCGDQSESFGPAQDRARDQHRGDQSHDRGRACGRRLGAASLCAVRSCQGDESPGDGEAVAGRCGSAARTRRPAEHGYLLPLVVRGRAGDARRRRHPPRSCMRTWRRSPSSSPAGALQTPRTCAGSIRRRPPRSRRRTICCGCSGQSMRRGASRRTAARSPPWALTRDSRIC